MDSLNRTRDRPNNTWIHQMFCFMFTFYLNTELKEDKTVVTPDKLPMVMVHNMWEQFDGHHCGAHITYWIMMFKRHFDVNEINVDTYDSDKNFARTIGDSLLFWYDVVHDMDQLRKMVEEEKVKDLEKNSTVCKIEYDSSTSEMNLF
eukprot:3806306-Ditylum_brightwellii.AAC.1